MDHSSYTILFNCVLIYANCFIFKNKYTQTIPIFNRFMQYLKYNKNLERIIAMAKDKVIQHENQWNKLKLF